MTPRERGDLPYLAVAFVLVLVLVLVVAYGERWLEDVVQFYPH